MVTENNNNIPSEIYIELGWEACKQENYILGIHYFNLGIAADPAYAHAYWSRGRAYCEIGKYQEAIVDFKKALQYDPRPKARRPTFTTSFDQQTIPYNIEKMVRNLAKDIMHSAMYYVDLGTAYYMLKNYDQAVAALTKAINLHPEAIRYQQHKNSYFLTNHERCAVEDYVEGIANYSANIADMYCKLGEIYHAWKKYHEAIANYTKAINHDPQNARYYSLRASTYNELNQHNEAIADYTRAISYYAQNDNFYYVRAQVYCKLQWHKHALIDFTRAIKYNPKNYSYYFSRAGIYNVLKKYHEAAADYTRAIYYAPENDRTFTLSFIDKAAIFYKRGKVYLKLKEYSNAINDFDYAIILRPRRSSYYYYRSQAFFALQNYHDALYNATQSIVLTKKQIKLVLYYQGRAAIYQKLGQHSAANDDYRRSCQLDPNNQSYKMHLDILWRN